MAEGRQSFPWFSYMVALVLIMIFTLSPVIALAIFNANSATGGMGLTDLMAQLGVLGWLVLVPFPLGAFFLGGWLVALMTHIFVLHRRGKRHG